MSTPQSPSNHQLHSARHHSAARRIGYSLLPGDGFSYLLHLRPLEWPIMLAHTTLGLMLAVGARGLLSGQWAGTWLLAMVIWVVCLNGGTLAINSAFDRDEGDVGYLDAPPPPPRHLAAFSVALMAIGQLLALRLPSGFGLAYAACFAMSLAYSVPPLRLKAVAGADWLINMIGFGTLTPYAGWAATGRPLTETALWVLVAFMPLFASLYPLTQLYQLDEDRARGDRTLAIAIGVRASLFVALALALVAFATFTVAGVKGRIGMPGWAAIGVALGAWLVVLVPWVIGEPRWTPQQRKRGMYSALGAWAITDLAMLFTFGGHGL